MALKDDAVTIFAAGANISTGAASANAAIPNCSSGEKPRYIRVSASVAAYVKLGIGSGTTATANDPMVQPGDAVIFAVGAATYVAALQVASAGKVQVSPLENM